MSFFLLSLSAPSLHGTKLFPFSRRVAPRRFNSSSAKCSLGVAALAFLEVFVLGEREGVRGMEEVDECVFHLPFVDWVGKCEGRGRVHREVELHTRD